MSRAANDKQKSALTPKPKVKLREDADTKEVKLPGLPWPRSDAQRDLLSVLTSDTRPSHIVVMGPAGTGKTYLAVRYALSTGLTLVISRPAVSTDEKHGFLPGTADEKMEPWLMPIIDIINEATGDPSLFVRMMKNGKIKIAPLAYIRGRTFKRSVMLLDEAQNATASQLKLWMTRIGEGSVNIMSGDTEQYDMGIGECGLSKVIKLFEGEDDPHVKILRFGKGDIQRHESISHVLSKAW